MIAADLLEILRCPITRQPLVLAEPGVLAEVNARHASSREDGPLDAALIRADRTALYPIIDGIPVLLPESLINL